MESVTRRGERWRARFKCPEMPKEQSQTFRRKRDAEDWIDAERRRILLGTWRDPRQRHTVESWCRKWLAGYGTNRVNTVRLASYHVRHIVEGLGPLPLESVRPSDVREWMTAVSQRYSADWTSALHARLSQIMSEAVADGVIERSPVSRKTAPPSASQRPLSLSDGQVWALHGQMPARLRIAVSLGAFAGLRIGEVCGAERTDFVGATLFPAKQWPSEPLKTEESAKPIPLADDLVAELEAHFARFPSSWVISTRDGAQGGPWLVWEAFAAARVQVGLPGVQFHDLRHYFASMLIASGLDVKVVQARLRHASARTTLDTYGHLWPDSETASSAAIQAAMRRRAA